MASGPQPFRPPAARCYAAGVRNGLSTHFTAGLETSTSRMNSAYRCTFWHPQCRGPSRIRLQSFRLPATAWAAAPAAAGLLFALLWLRKLRRTLAIAESPEAVAPTPAAHYSTRRN